MGKTHFLSGILVILSLSTGILVASHGTVHAATFTVSKTADTNDGTCDSDCSLREAIAAATSGDTVDIPAGTYTLTLGSELVINKDLSLTGAGAATTIIQAAATKASANHRVINITTGTVAISDVTIRHGNLIDHGAGILNSGTLTITDSTFRDNSASNIRHGGDLPPIVVPQVMRHW